MALLQPIQPFKSGSNPSETWNVWKQDFMCYLKALKYHKEDNDVQTSLFLQVCGPELKTLYKSFKLPESKTITLKSDDGSDIEETVFLPLSDVIKAYDDHFKGYKNLTYASFVFWNLKQDSMTFDEFVAAVKVQAVECEFELSESRNIKDKIIHGMSDKSLQERLLNKTNLDLEELIKFGQQSEASKYHIKSMNDSQTLGLDYVKNKTFSKQTQENKNKSSNQSTVESNFRCSRCGNKHKKKECPAHGSTCHKCKGKNHWANVCKSRKSRIDEVENKSTSEKCLGLHADQVIYLDLVIDGCFSSKDWTEKIKINGTDITFKLDTGAQANIISHEILSKIGLEHTLKNTSARLETYTGQSIPVAGECILECKFGNKVSPLKFVVTKINSRPILGAHDCESMGLINRVNALSTDNVKTDQSYEKILEDFNDVFDGIGRLKGTYKIELKDNISPHIASPRRLPVALEDKVKLELCRLESENIITKVEEPTDWVSNICVVLKPDKSIRLCLDPRPLNEAVKRPRYQIPNIESLLTKYSNTNTFSLFDIKNAFWHVQLDEKSSYLTTFTTPFGRYRFKVLPFGISMAPELFQMVIDQVFENHPEITPYFDDILLASTEENHKELVIKFLTIAREAGLKLNRKKVHLARNQVPYLGFILSKDGISPDPQKLKAITDFQIPTCKTDLQRFLGMCTYLMKFAKNLSHETHYLRQLLKKDTPWTWDVTSQKQFDNLKSLLTNAPILRYFDKDLPITCQVDSSSFGLGACLLQEGRPIAYASASLTETQKSWAQIEKELLSVVFGIEKFNYFLLAKPVEILTDHKPLLGLSKKPLDKLSPRIQRLMMRLLGQEIHWTYIRGKDNSVADALSRCPQPNEYFPINEPKYKASVCLVVQTSPTALERVQKATNEDPEMKTLVQFVKHGWPTRISQVPLNVRNYWPYRDELYYCDGLICKGSQLILPRECRSDALTKVHQGHRGIVSCKNRARESIFWPKINQEIEKMVANCDQCQRYQRSNQNEPLKDRTIPQRPWQTIAMDFFFCHQNTYLLICDYFSKFIEVVQTPSTNAQTVIRCLQPIFARFGYPDEIISDRGPPFDSNEFHKFANKYLIKLNPSTPEYPRSNGLSERQVQTIKRSIKKSLEAGEDLYDVLIAHRTTPMDGLPSPAEILFGRKLKTMIPTLPKTLNETRFDKIRQQLENRQLKQKEHGNKKTKPLSSLTTGQSVWLQRNKVWQKGKVVEANPETRCYTVESEGKPYVRNRFYLRPAQPDQQPLAPVINQPIPTPEISNDNKKTDDNTQATKTRSGRVVKQPKWLKDYET